MVKLNFSEISVLVVGDVMLDKYYYGKVRRISPEAPIPVVKVTKSNFSPGGASNVSRNITNLQANAYLIGVAGNDNNRDILNNLLRDSNINSYLLETHHPTTTKMRVIGEHQQIVRLDFEENEPIDNIIADKLKEHICSLLKHVHSIIISDYGKGVCTHDLCQHIFSLAIPKNIPVIVDPKGTSWDKYVGATIVTPNLNELREISGCDIKNEDFDIEKNGLAVLKQYKFENLLVTRSEKGMTLISKSGTIHLPTEAKEVYDVSGAGDTVVATLAVGLASGMNLHESTRLSNKAAGIVVSKFGTAPIEYHELVDAYIANENGKTLAYEAISKTIENLRNKHKKIVFTNGCFDILHRGHITYLNEARKFGDVLIVGLNSDHSIKLLKGENRPINSQEDRAYILANLEAIDYVVIFNEDTPFNLIKLIRPDFLIKGGDYRIDEVVGRDFAKETVILPFIHGYSTTDTIKKAIAQLEII